LAEHDVDERSGRERLIEAAAIEFSRNGFEAASVLAIAERAGVKQPLLNYHFGSKENLWRTVVQGAFAASADEWLQAASLLEGSNPLERLHAVLHVFARINVRHPLAHSLVLREIASGGPRLDWVVETYIKPFHQMLDETITECVRQGLLKVYPAQHASLMMTSLLTAVLATYPIAERIYRVGAMDADSWSEHASQALDALFNGILTDEGRKGLRKSWGNAKYVGSAPASVVGGRRRSTSKAQVPR
jgi:AcrR family transcriptional regulator